VTEAIRAPEISRGASVVSARPVVRQSSCSSSETSDTQRREGSPGGTRHRTVVFPDAQVKFFLTASDAARAQRRHAELADKGIQVPLEEVLADQQRRDKDDTERAISPLRPAPDAIRVDTTGLDLGEWWSAVSRSVQPPEASDFRQP